MTSARLVAAKFRMAAASVLFNWTLAVAGTTCWLVVSDNLDNADDSRTRFLQPLPRRQGFRDHRIGVHPCCPL